MKHLAALMRQIMRGKIRDKLVYPARGGVAREMKYVCHIDDIVINGIVILL